MNKLPADGNRSKTANPTGDAAVPTPIVDNASADKEKERQRRKQQCSRYLKKAPAWIEAACAILLVAITGTYTYYAGGQLEAMNGQLSQMETARQQSAIQWETTRKTLQQDRRAYLILKMLVPNTIKLSEPFVGKGSITNKGKTAAKQINVEIAIGVVQNDAAPPSAESIPGETMFYPIIQPDAVEDLPVKWFGDLEGRPHRLTQTEYADLVAGRAFILARANMTYRDIYGVDHWQHFCTWQTYTPPNTDKFAKFTNFASRFCVNYNNVDEN